MQEIVNMLSMDLRYMSHSVENNTITIRIESIKPTSVCSYCGVESNFVHSVYERKAQDLPIQGKKVILLIKRRKFFCLNKECTHKTYAEQFNFIKTNARKTNRLQAEILEVSLTQSSISASKYLRKNIADVGKSTICNLLKKRDVNNE